jgi:dihydrofolate reductase
MITIISAIQNDRGIGSKGTLPWHIPEDLTHFKEVTTGHPIIMGRRTFESIGRALPNRTNIVLSSDNTWNADGVIVARDFASALTTASESAGGTEIFIIGGAGVYASALSHADRILLTEVDALQECDAFFPEFKSRFPLEITRKPFTSESGVSAAFVEYRKA